jgi:tetratricopeptide (TPR) repeat protein
MKPFYQIISLVLLINIGCNKEEDVNYQKGKKFYESEDYVSSINELNQSIANNPMSDSAYYLRASGKYMLSDFSGAIIDYDKSLDINPENAEAFYFRGISKGLTKNKNGACLDLSKAGELGYEEAYNIIKKYCN